MILEHNPPDNCHASQVCIQNELKRDPAPLRNHQGIVDGVAYGGCNYHLEDFVLYQSNNDGPAHIGYIINITFPDDEAPNVCMRCVGRVNTVLEAIPIGIIKDEVCIVFFFFKHC